MKKKIAVLAGDGVGPELIEQALLVLQKINFLYKHEISTENALIGGASYDVYQEHCSSETLSICDSADAILFGSVGGPVQHNNEAKWLNCETNSILALRKKYSFSTNIRPINLYRSLSQSSPLKNKLISQGNDLVIFRELLGDIYFGKHEEFINDEGQREARDLAIYTEKQIAPIIHKAFQVARRRSKRLCSVDKANVLSTSKLWRSIVEEIAPTYKDVIVEHMYVDNAAMQLILNPSQFDVLVTANLFGDILSDLGAALPGSIGLVPSASLNEQGFGLYEPSGGSAFALEAKNEANPVAQILSLALLLELSFNLHNEAHTIKNALRKTLDAGYRTKDIYSAADPSSKLLGTAEFSRQIIQNMELAQ